MFQMMNNSWFHGDISQKEAFSLLADRPVGSFILRFSGTRNSFVSKLRDRKTERQGEREREKKEIK